MDIAANETTTLSTQAQNRGGDSLVRSVLGALAYADLFDFPLTQDEIWRYQIKTRFSRTEIDLGLATSPDLLGAIARDGSYYCLRGREEVFEIRRSRELASRAVWKRARLYSRWLSRLPFVRMVAITGALAVDNIATRPDIDLLVVAREGRVWICRRLIVGLVRIARLFGDDLCPNYIIAETNLDLEQQDLFTAHELAQMVPLYGRKSYINMLARNIWASDYLPEALIEPSYDVLPLHPGPARRLIEAVLSLGMFNILERWELARLQRKMRPLVGDDAEVICSPQQCKGHTGLHRQWVTTRYSERLEELGI